MKLSSSGIGFALFLGALAALPPLAIDMALPALTPIAAAMGTTATNAGLTPPTGLIESRGDLDDWPARWSPGGVGSARGSGPLPHRLALPVCQQIAEGSA